MQSLRPTQDRSRWCGHLTPPSGASVFPSVKWSNDSASLVGLSSVVCLAERLARSKCPADVVSGRDGGERAFPTVGAREGPHGLSPEDVGALPPPPPWSPGTLCDVSLPLLAGPPLPSLALGWGPPTCPSCTVMPLLGGAPALARPTGGLFIFVALPVCVFCSGQAAQHRLLF